MPGLQRAGPSGECGHVGRERVEVPAHREHHRGVELDATAHADLASAAARSSSVVGRVRASAAHSAPAVTGS